MWDPFSYSGPKSAERLEDERYIRALRMRDLEGMTSKRISEALGINHETLRWRFSVIDKA